MNNILIYCEIEEGKIAGVSLELISKGRKLANELGCQVEALVIGYKLKGIEKEFFPYGVDFLHIADSKDLKHFTTLPHAEIYKYVIQTRKPQIALTGATVTGRDLAPRVSSAMKVGLTADCTNLVIGQYENKKSQKVYDNLLYQIRPAFGGNIIATIVNPDTRPQMATVREGVMKQEIVSADYKGEIINIDVASIVTNDHKIVKVLAREIEERKVNLSGSQIIVCGGFGMGSKENFNKLFELAEIIGAEVAASRAAVDAGFAEHDRQVGQTGVTVRPKLYIACGISGAIQHTAGMDGSAQIISVNIDTEAPINKLADVAITGSVESVIPKMIKYYKEASK